MINQNPDIKQLQEGVILEIKENKINDIIIHQFFVKLDSQEGKYILYNKPFIAKNYKTGEKVNIEYIIKEKVKSGKKYKNCYIYSISHFEKLSKRKNEIIQNKNKLDIKNKLIDEIEEQRFFIYKVVEGRWELSGKKFSELKQIMDFYLELYTEENKNSWKRMNDRMIEIIIGKL